MKTFFVAIVAALAVQLCLCTVPEEAENKLHELRHKTNQEIERAFGEHNRMSTDVDQVALATKLRGAEEIHKKTDKFLAKLKSDRAVSYKCRGSRDHIYHHIEHLHSDELTRCVDQQGSDSVTTLNTQRMALVEYVWNAIYEEEKHIILCGKDSKCLDAAIADIVDKIYEIGQVIKDEVQISKHNKEVKLQAINGCLSRHVANAEHALGNVPTCTF